MARPKDTPKYTNEQIITALKETKGLISLAAKRLGCEPDTIRNRAKKLPAIQTVVNNQRSEIIDTAELALWKAVQNSEQWAIAMVLKTIGKDRGYVERQEMTGNNGAPLQITIAYETIDNGSSDQTTE